MLFEKSVKVRRVYMCVCIYIYTHNYTINIHISIYNSVVIVEGGVGGGEKGYGEINDHEKNKTIF